MTTDQTYLDYTNTEYELGREHICVYLLCAPFQRVGDGYIFGRGDPEGVAGSAVVWGDHRQGLWLSAEMIYEVLFPLRESWRFRSTAKSARA